MVEDLDVPRASPSATGSAAGGRSAVSLITSERESVSGVEPTAVRCRSRVRRRPFASPPWAGGPHGRYSRPASRTPSPVRSPASLSGELGMAWALWADAKGALGAGNCKANSRAVRIVNTNRAVASRTVRPLSDFAVSQMTLTGEKACQVNLV
jgi:hypothetical protein